MRDLIAVGFALTGGAGLVIEAFLWHWQAGLALLFIMLIVTGAILGTG